jgi:hypothetical protein
MGREIRGLISRGSRRGSEGTRHEGSDVKIIEALNPPRRMAGDGSYCANLRVHSRAVSS